MIKKGVIQFAIMGRTGGGGQCILMEKYKK